MSEHNGARPTGSVQTRIVLRPLASGAPLAFFAFGVGTILFTAQEVGWAPVTDQHGLAILLIAFVAPLEILAGLAAAAGRDTGLATTMLLFGAVWASIGITMLTSAPGSRSVILGIFLLTVSTMLLAMSTAAVIGKPLLFALSILAVLRFVLSGVYEVSASKSIEHASGWFGIPIVAIAIYGGLSFLLEDSLHRTVLPIGRRKEAKEALAGGIDAQTAELHHEAGVRAQL